MRIWIKKKTYAGIAMIQYIRSNVSSASHQAVKSKAKKVMVNQLLVEREDRKKIVSHFLQKKIFRTFFSVDIK